MKNNRVIRYIIDSYAELKKVSWPTRKQLIKDTIVVLVVSAIITAFVGIIDLGLSKVLEYLVGLQG